MDYVYHPQGVCSMEIKFHIDGDVISNVRFTGGCNGNLKAIGKLVEGMEREKLIEMRQMIRRVSEWTIRDKANVMIVKPHLLLSVQRYSQNRARLFTVVENPLAISPFCCRQEQRCRKILLSVWGWTF